MDRTSIRLRGFNGAVEGKAWKADALLRVGRLRDFEICLEHDSVSRRHSEISRTAQGWTLCDLGSTNGTFLNGTRVGRAKKEVHPGDFLQFGDVCLVVDAIDGHTPQSPHSTPGELRVLGSVRQSWEELKQRALAGDAGLAPLWTRLVGIGRDFRPCKSLDALLQTILWESAEIFDTLGVSITLFDPKTGFPREKATLNVGEATEAELEVHGGLSLFAFRQEESLLVQTGRPGAGDSAGSSGGKGSRSILCALLRTPEEPIGVLCLSRREGQGLFGEKELRQADALALAVAVSVASLAQLLRGQTEQAVQTQMVLAELVNFRDKTAAGHNQRVTDYALLLAEELGLSEPEKDLLQAGAALHDLGTLGVGDLILGKAAPLTEREARELRVSLVRAASLVESVPFLSPLVPVLRNLRERWDGTGYPDGLAGNHIPLQARIISLAEAFDAMTNERPYRAALSLDQTYEEVKQQAGTQFDPDCVSALCRLRPRIERMFLQKENVEGTLARQDMADLVHSLKRELASHSDTI